MRTASWPKAALALATLVAAAPVGTGCGEDQGQPEVVTPASTPEQIATTKGRSNRREEKKPSSGNRRGMGPKTEKDKKQEVREATKTFLERLPPARRKQTVKQIVELALKTFGFSGATVAVGPKPNQVTVAVPRSQACKAGPRDPMLMTRRITEVAPIVTAVAVIVANDGSPLDRYITANCRAAYQLPGGNGRTVLRQTGEGLVNQTRAFTVRAKRWSIDYRNDGQFLTVLVLKGGRPAPAAVSSTQRGKGTKKTSLGPGAYRLRIIGSSSWTVRVRDGT